MLKDTKEVKILSKEYIPRKGDVVRLLLLPNQPIGVVDGWAAKDTVCIRFSGSKKPLSVAYDKDMFQPLFSREELTPRRKADLGLGPIALAETCEVAPRPIRAH